MMTSVRRVLVVSPPITVMANGAPKPETYSPSPMAKGTIAIIVVMAVMIYLLLWIPRLLVALVMRMVRRRA